MVCIVSPVLILSISMLVPSCKSPVGNKQDAADNKAVYVLSDPHTDPLAGILFWLNGRPDHFYGPYPGYPSAGDFIKFKEDSITMFLSGTRGIYESGYINMK